jgi:hypothetical protein
MANTRRRDGGQALTDGSVRLSSAEVWHLRTALVHEELLLTTRKVDDALVYLVEVLRHLRALAPAVT